MTKHELLALCRILAHYLPDEVKHYAEVSAGDEPTVAEAHIYHDLKTLQEVVAREMSAQAHD